MKNTGFPAKFILSKFIPPSLKKIVVMMCFSSFWFVMVVMALALQSYAYIPRAFTSGRTTLQSRASTLLRPKSAFSLCAALDCSSEADLDSYISREELIIIDYSTTWCGPCKVIAPKFEELSETYGKDGAGGSVFLKVTGDSSKDASALMKREGVRSVPAFHFYKGGEKVDVVNVSRAALFALTVPFVCNFFRPILTLHLGG